MILGDSSLQVLAESGTGTGIKQSESTGSMGNEYE